MKKILSLILLLMFLPVFTAQAAAPESVLARAVEIIGDQESGHNYGLFILDTNGKVSAGFLQWNAGRANALMRSIIDESGSDISFDGTLSMSDKSWASPLLKSDAGRAVQDSLARKDISSYIEKAMDLGIRDLTALCYYADIAHQVGSGAVVKYHKLAAEKAGGYPSVTLEHLYQAALNYATHTKTRRTRVYKLLKENPVKESGKPEAPSAPAATITITGQSTMRKGERQILTAVLSGGENQPLKWSSANKRIAKVNQKGRVIALKKGKAVIRCKTKSGLIAKFNLTVTK